MRQVVKTFLGVPALRGVNLTVARGQVHGLVGRNGAGKSTEVVPVVVELEVAVPRLMPALR